MGYRGGRLFDSDALDASCVALGCPSVSLWKRSSHISDCVAANTLSKVLALLLL